MFGEIRGRPEILEALDVTKLMTEDNTIGAKTSGKIGPKLTSTMTSPGKTRNKWVEVTTTGSTSITVIGPMQATMDIPLMEVLIGVEDPGANKAAQRTSWTGKIWRSH